MLLYQHNKTSKQSLHLFNLLSLLVRRRACNNSLVQKKFKIECLRRIETRKQKMRGVLKKQSKILKEGDDYPKKRNSRSRKGLHLGRKKSSRHSREVLDNREVNSRKRIRRSIVCLDLSKKKSSRHNREVKIFLRIVV